MANEKQFTLKLESIERGSGLINHACRELLKHDQPVQSDPPEFTAADPPTDN